MAGKVYITEEGKKQNTAGTGRATGSGGATRQTASQRTAGRGGLDDAFGRTDAGGGRTDSLYGRTSAGGRERISSVRDKAEDKEIEELARKMLKKKEKRRRIISIVVAAVAVLSIGVFIFVSVSDYNKSISYQMLSNIRDKHGDDTIFNNPSLNSDQEVHINYDGEREIPDVLPEFKEMLAVNSKLIGWLKIDDTNIDYPVAQTSDNEYYLDHDLNQNKDRNGTIFLDTNCDVIKPSTNLILYGHHMRSGNMFGNLGKYEDESYYEKHKYITFDTLYEHGTYEVMYVFRSHVFTETEVAFKYYQFIDAYSEVEFDSYMEEMAGMSLYDTGVTASFGDRLLTLSTCDYQEKDGRFVVVAKKIK